MTDRSSEHNLGDAWLAFGRVLAVGLGALIALVSLLHHVPLAAASLRGALVFVGVWLIARTSHALLARVDEPERTPHKPNR